VMSTTVVARSTGRARQPRGRRRGASAADGASSRSRRKVGRGNRSDPAVILTDRGTYPYQRRPQPFAKPAQFRGVLSAPDRVAKNTGLDVCGRYVQVYRYENAP
jgi:hypothetical protein